MFRRVTFCVLYLIAMLAVLGSTGCADARFASTPIGRSEPTRQQIVLDEPLPIPLIELSGDPQQIGAAHGQQLASQIHTLETRYLDPQIGGEAKKFVAFTAAAMFRPYIPPQYLQEISALAKSAEMDPRSALLAQCFLDLTDSVACSTMALSASASPDGVARMGRNLDFPSRGVLQDMSVVLIYRPAGKVQAGELQTGEFQFAAVTWPGFVGVVSGMNEHGLTLANMEVNRAPRMPQAMPYPLLYRTILERCKTVDEAIALLQSTPRQSANNLMLMDAAGNRAVVEIKPESIEVRRADDQHALLSTNHQRGQDESSPGKCWRYDLLHTATANLFGEIGVTQIEQMLAGAMQGKNGGFTIQSMIFEPANRVMYLATGSGAAHQKFYRVDLNRYFHANS